MEVATKTEPSEQQWRDLLFAWRVVRHVRSNAIVLARDRATLGIGAGQMSRVDSVRLAIEKAKEARGPDGAAPRRVGDCVGCVLPVRGRAAGGDRRRGDGGDPAGGSRRDAEVIEACDAAGVAMVFTKRRHFRH